MWKESLKRLYRGVVWLTIGVFLTGSLTTPVQAQVLELPLPGQMVHTSEAFVPPLLKGMTLYPEDPLRFDFILDTGNSSLEGAALRAETKRLVRYFLASLTVPRDDLWVNLSPYEKDRVMPEALSQTELGRDLLGLDYLLKQLTASLMYPEKELGQSFWRKVYQEAREKYGTTEIPVNTFNKVWIVPDRAVVYEHGQTVYVMESHLKVMLEEDYLAREHNVLEQNHVKPEDPLSPVQAQVIREVLIPAIEKEVNEGRQFAPLRQIYHALILAQWYKNTIQDGLLALGYEDRNIVRGIESDDPLAKQKIYQWYQEAFRKGVYNYIREDRDPVNGQMIPRKYFSGGIPLGQIAVTKTGAKHPAEQIAASVIGEIKKIPVRLRVKRRWMQLAGVDNKDRVSFVQQGLIGSMEAGEWRFIMGGGLSASSPLDWLPGRKRAKVKKIIQTILKHPSDTEDNLSDLKRLNKIEDELAVVFTSLVGHLRRAVRQVVEDEDLVNKMVFNLLPEAYALYETGEGIELVANEQQVHKVPVKKQRKVILANYPASHSGDEIVEEIDTEAVLALSRKKTFNNLAKLPQGLRTAVNRLLAPEGDNAKFIEARQTDFFSNKFSTNKTATYEIVYQGEEEIPQWTVRGSGKKISTQEKVTLVRPGSNLEAARQEELFEFETSVEEEKPIEDAMIDKKKYVPPKEMTTIFWVDTAAKKIRWGDNGIASKDDDEASSAIDRENVGGIDFNDIRITRFNAGKRTQALPFAPSSIFVGTIDGVFPVIQNVLPVPDLLPLLGLSQGP